MGVGIMKNKNYDYVVVDGKTNEIVCKHCGERQKLKMPMSIDIFSKVCQFFVNSHKGCLNKKVVNDDDDDDDDNYESDRSTCSCRFCYCLNETEYGEVCSDCLQGAHQG